MDGKLGALPKHTDVVTVGTVPMVMPAVIIIL